MKHMKRMIPSIIPCTFVFLAARDASRASVHRPALYSVSTYTYYKAII